ARSHGPSRHPAPRGHPRTVRRRHDGRRDRACLRSGGAGRIGPRRPRWRRRACSRHAGYGVPCSAPHGMEVVALPGGPHRLFQSTQSRSTLRQRRVPARRLDAAGLVFPSRLSGRPPAPVFAAATRAPPPFSRSHHAAADSSRLDPRLLRRRRSRMSMRDYVAMARVDHWIKNIFVLPGVLLAALMSRTPVRSFWMQFLVGVASVCLIASANYIMNEWVDADFDRFHPVKKDRPAVRSRVSAGAVLAEYLLALVLGLILAAFVSLGFFITACAFALAGGGSHHRAVPHEGARVPRRPFRINQQPPAVDARLVHRHPGHPAAVEPGLRLLDGRRVPDGSQAVFGTALDRTR